ncbi:MarP family serine protease [Spongisporangium articulatum]|uniref:MarP family serine protease n=1 Tax=Spongisporangium articulatum TaxID=3362603 RepID=A0ABW8AIU6_9ACTN
MIDLVLLALLIAYAVSGFRQGVVIGLLSLGGFVGGAVLAIWLVPRLVSGLEEGPQRSFVVLVAVIVAAWTGQFAGALLGGRLRESIPKGPLALVDHVAGGLAGLVAVSLVLWFVAGAIRGGPSEALSKMVGRSEVIKAIDSVVPAQFDGVADSFRSAVGGSAFPRVFSGFGAENIVPVDPPDDAVTSSDAVRRARGGIVKITGAANCSRGQEGSGFVVAPGRVVTNAHVVAGVTSPEVQVRGVGRRYQARVVLFDPRRDIAVLAVPGLPAKTLDLGADQARGDSAVVAGFPNDGPFTVDAARVRQVLKARGVDIYGKTDTVRSVYSLYATVEPGNSGGPLLDSRGDVVGVVFAKSLDDDRTAYALTMTEARSTIEKGVNSSTPVGRTSCTAG